MSLRLRVVLFTLTILLPAVIGGGWMLYKSVAEQQAHLADEAAHANQSLQREVAQELDRRIAMMQILADSPELRAWNLPAFCQLIHSLRDKDPVVLADPEKLIATSRTADCSANKTPNLIPSAFTSGPITISDPFHSSQDGTPLVTLNLPVTGDGRLYNLALGMRISFLQSLLEAQNLPRGWTAAVTNRSGTVLARVPDPDKWVGRPASSYAAQANGHAFVPAPPPPDSSGRLVGKANDGTITRVFFSNFDKYGIQVFVGIPEDLLAVSHTSATRTAFVGSFLLLTVSLLFAVWVGQQVSRPIDSLQESAIALTEGKPLSVKPQGVRELDRIGESLQLASHRILAHNQALEERVAEAVARVEAAQSRLAQGQKLEAIGRLTGGIAHDFNNFLQTVSTGLQVLERLPQSDQAGPVLEASRRAVNRASSLVRQLLAFGRTTPMQPRAIDLRNQLLAMQPLLGKALRPGNHLRIEIAPDVWPVLADAGQLEVALLNLIFNANDALVAGGEITVAASNVPLPQGDMVGIEVWDTGGGIRDEDLPRIFEPFFTTKPVGQGAGLGLAQVWAFATQSGGSVSAQNVAGQGTCVTLLLPRSKQSPLAEDAPSDPPLLASERRVLFVEDDVLVAEVVGPALSGMGYAVIHVQTGDEALNMLRRGEHFDAVLSDVVMPGTHNGVQLAELIAREFPALHVVLASGYAAPDQVPAGVPLLAKPYSLQALALSLAPISETDADSSRPIV